jgi:hypothetical protein
VNLSHVRALQRRASGSHQLVLSTGEAVPVSRARLAQVRTLFSPEQTKEAARPAGGFLSSDTDLVSP